MKAGVRVLAMAPVLLLAVTMASAWDMSNLDMDKATSGAVKLFKATAGLSDEEEIKLGRDVAANLAARYGLVDDAAKLHYLNLVGHAVAQRSSRANLPYHFGILKSSEFNAFSAPGGYIFVTQGLLAGLHDEAELAGVLAHEISHVTERHVVKAIREANLFGAGKDMVAALGQDPDAWSTMTDFTINLMDKGFSRKDELEADRLGTLLAGKVGYDARGLRDSVERLTQVRDKDSAFTRFNGTHPPPAERLKAIDQALKKKPSAPDAPRLQDRFAKNI